MSTKIHDTIPAIGSSAAPTTKSRYTAKELGEMFNSHSPNFFLVDIGLCTDWYTNNDFMEEFISYIENEEAMNHLIHYILLFQERQVCEEHPKVCCRVSDSRKFAPFVEDLKEKLDAMRLRVLHKREIEEKMAELQKMWSMPTSTASQLDMVSAEDTSGTTDKTSPPVFSEDTGEKIIYHLSDLPEDIQKHVLIETDEVYSQFVETMQGPVKAWIEKHHLYDWNVVRFICRHRGIVSQHCSLHVFGCFLEKIGLGNQESNMKQRKDANDKNAMIIYDDPVKSQKIWQLKRDGKIVEEMLIDTIKSVVA